MERRVAITGIGIVSSLGNTFADVCVNLAQGRSGIRPVERWARLELTSRIGGVVDEPDHLLRQSGLPKKQLNYASESAVYCAIAAQQALEDAAIDLDTIERDKVGCLVGNGTSGLLPTYRSAKMLYEGRWKRVNPYTVCQVMANSCSAVVANLYGVKGRSYSISGACATSALNIGHAYELIRDGQLDMAIAGGGEEFNELITAAFAAMRMALSTHHNDTPSTASRPYDSARDGFVMSGGAGIVILEALDSARQRGAPLHGEIIGYAANTDAHDFILPDPRGLQAAACMTQAVKSANINRVRIDYVNTHGTSTVEGDLAEVRALRRVFGTKVPPLSSTKSMSGHAIGAAGAHEVIYCLGMLGEQFLAPSINIERLDPEFADLPIVTTARDASLDTIMSNSFGFGGANAVLILKRLPGTP